MELLCIGLVGLFAILWIEERQYRQGLEQVISRWQQRLREAGWTHTPQGDE